MSAAYRQERRRHICYWIADAERYFQRTFGRPTVLVWFDTLITAAQYATAGGDNDTAQAQLVMNTLRAISERTGTFCIGVDHFGKVIETGTRGSSAKEGAADTVIVLLGDRELSGGIKNTRLALRKQRDGISGLEVPFSVINKEAGVDEDGDAVTAPPVIDWRATVAAAKGTSGGHPQYASSGGYCRLPLRAARTCSRSLTAQIVRACDIEAMRAEFYLANTPWTAPRNRKPRHARRRGRGRSRPPTETNWCASARWTEPSSSGLPKPMTARKINRPCRPSGQRDRQGHTLGVCPVPSRYCSSVASGHTGTLSRIVPSRPVPAMVVSAKPAKTRYTPHNFFFAYFTSRKGSNDAATTRRKWAIYDFVPRTSASHTEGICLQKTSSYGSF